MRTTIRTMMINVGERISNFILIYGHLANRTQHIRVYLYILFSMNNLLTRLQRNPRIYVNTFSLFSEQQRRTAAHNTRVSVDYM
jgi:hypothetical protein